MIRHKKSVHEKANDEKCDKCSYKTSCAGNLERHKMTVHEKVKDQKCEKMSTQDKCNLKRLDNRKNKVYGLCDFEGGEVTHLLKDIKAPH